MEERIEKAKKKYLRMLLILAVCGAACVGGAFYAGQRAVQARGQGNFASWEVDAYKSVALAGVLLLVVAFGYVLPKWLRVKKGDWGILDERNMYKALNPYVPAGETLRAAVHAVSLKKVTKQVYSGCRYTEEALIPDAGGKTYLIEKSKHSTHDMYIGITAKHLIVKEAEECTHAYSVQEIDMPDLAPISAPVENHCMGTCFPLELITKCTVSSAGGMQKCTIELSDGSLFKFKLAEKAGLGMPNHEQNRRILLDYMERFQ